MVVTVQKEDVQFALQDLKEVLEKSGDTTASVDDALFILSGSLGVADIDSIRDQGAAIISDLSGQAGALFYVTGPHGSELKLNKVGGINLDPALLDLQIKRDGNWVPLPIEQQPVDSFMIEGFVPVLIQITPVPIAQLPMLLGLADIADDDPRQTDDYLQQSFYDLKARFEVDEALNEEIAS